VVITCPSCNERYRLSADKIKGKGAKITCPSCRHLFVVFADNAPAKRTGDSIETDTTTGAFKAVGLDEPDSPATTTGSIRVVAPGPRGKKRAEVTTVATSFNGLPVLDDLAEPNNDESVESHNITAEAISEEPSEADLKASDLDFREVGIVTWKVKVSIGLVYDFSDIMTLKKYLDDQKVTPDDLISHNAKDWTRIGDVGDLDDHFVTTWKAARDALKAGGSAPKKKSRAKAAPAEGDAESREAIAAASREVAGGQSTLGPPMEDPFAKAREQRRARGGRRRPKQEVKPSPGPGIKAVLVAVLVLGVLFGGVVWMQGQHKPGSEPTTETSKADAQIEEADSAKVAAARIKERIEEQMQRTREEIQAGMTEEAEISSGDKEPDPLEEALRKARRVAVRPEDQTVQVSRTDDKGFKQPIQQPSAARAAAPAAATKTKGSAQITEQKTRDPGRVYYDHGRKQMKSKNYGSALKMFLASVDKSPQCGVCWEGLGSAYQASGEAQKAANAFKKAEELGVPINAARP